MKFVKGHSRHFKKVCTSCHTEYMANSGTRKKCPDCCRCKECSAQMINGLHAFCSISCAGKWKYRNNDKVKSVIQEGRKLSQTPEALEKTAAFHRGKPKLHLRKPLADDYRQRRHQAMQRIEYKTWRKQVFERDNYTCQLCGLKGCYLEADHIIPLYIDSSLELDLNNGRALCRPCHQGLDSWGHKVKTRYKLPDSYQNRTQ